MQFSLGRNEMNIVFISFNFSFSKLGFSSVI
jgi:hypothetical protein